ncbi:MAG TPA: rRNA methyltransferase, partial [Flavobacteriaceae bacterium]|nr:rRNA methyltransferase [Flavobacteriaceae bacterium]
MNYLSSNKNPELKRLRLLSQKARERKKLDLFVIEGERELKKALIGGYTINSLFIEEGSELEYTSLCQKLEDVDQFLVSVSAFEQIS